jgi:hypothetical protein
MLSFVIGVMFINLGNKHDDESISGRVGVLFYVANFMVFTCDLSLISFILFFCLLLKSPMFSIIV